VIGDGTIALRILVAAALGGLIGLEREFKEQPAGLRTHMLVSLGACLFTLVSAFGFDAFTGRPSTLAVRADVTRIASQVVVGIGFLGGGTILRHGATIRGLTTAAALWVTAAVGMAVGMGFYLGALVTGAVAVFSLAGLKPIERRLVRGIRQEEPPRSIEPD
jgi:putative Mg2+ transporter-C (MgtC) family protein